MTDLQLLVSKTSNTAALIVAHQLKKEVIELGRIMFELKASNDQLIANSNQKESDWLTISQETDETIAALKSDNSTMKAALLEVIKALDSGNPAIVDTVWVSTGQPETLRDHCFSAVYGETYEVKP